MPINSKLKSKNTQTQTESDACPVVQLVHGKKPVDEEKGMEKHTNIGNEYEQHTASEYCESKWNLKQ